MAGGTHPASRRQQERQSAATRRIFVPLTGKLRGRVPVGVCAHRDMRVGPQRTPGLCPGGPETGIDQDAAYAAAMHLTCAGHGPCSVEAGGRWHSRQGAGPLRKCAHSQHGRTAPSTAWRQPRVPPVAAARCVLRDSSHLLADLHPALLLSAISACPTLPPTADHTHRHGPVSAPGSALGGVVCWRVSRARLPDRPAPVVEETRGNSDRARSAVTLAGSTSCSAGCAR